jgi:FKBP-type peptidyl-prolyl cis-trans isomerase
MKALANARLFAAAVLGPVVAVALLGWASASLAEDKEFPMPDELIIEDLAVGEGEEAVNGKTAVVHYTGWLYDPDAADNKGAKFDSSRDRGAPFKFPVGGGRVIRGWDQGVAGMQVGGRRLLIIPPGLGYGASGAGGVIPPNAVLVFDVELLGVE